MIKVSEKKHTEAMYNIECSCFPKEHQLSKAYYDNLVSKFSNNLLINIDNNIVNGFVLGIPTNETIFNDLFFEDFTLANPNGKNIAIVGVAVLEEYRRLGIARKLLQVYINNCKLEGYNKIFLTCLSQLTNFYEKFGFKNVGLSDSSFGGSLWYQMELTLN